MSTPRTNQDISNELPKSGSIASEDLDNVSDKIPVTVTPRWIPLDENAKTLFPLIVDGVDDQNLVPEEMTVEEIELCLKVMEQSNETNKAENQLLENYLSSVDPTLIENMDKILEAATAAILKAERNVQLGVMASAATLSQQAKGSQESATSSPRSGGQKVGSKIGAFGVAEKGPKVQPSQKIEIIQREIDIIKAAFDGFQKKSQVNMFSMQCRQEECDIRMRETVAIRKEFDNNLTRGWIDRTTRRVPGEKIISFFELRSRSDALVKKALITRAKNLNIQHDAIGIRLKELGEDLHFVDYEQLIIQNSNIEQQLHNKLISLTDMKKTNSYYLSLLNTTRNKTMEAARATKHLENDLAKSDSKIMRLFRDESRIMGAIQYKQKLVDELVNLMKKYIAPEVLEYIRHNAELSCLKKALKIAEVRNRQYEERWSRKFKVGKPLVRKKEQQSNPAPPKVRRGTNHWKPLTSQYSAQSDT